MNEQLRDAEQALERMRARSSQGDQDLQIVLEGLMKVVKQLALHSWAATDEVEAQRS